MTPEIIISIVCSALGSAALFGFIQYLIDRHDKKKGTFKGLTDDIDKLGQQITDASAVTDRKIDEVKDEIKSVQEDVGDVKKDLCRIQLKDLIMTHPKQVIDISNLAQTYFKDMQGDQYLSPIFADWIDQYADGHDPDWFKRPEDKKKHY